MLRKNFPGRKKARQEEAMKRQAVNDTREDKSRHHTQQWLPSLPSNNDNIMGIEE